MNYKLLLLFSIYLARLGTIQAQISEEPTIGDGSEDNPYHIATLENIYWLSQDSESWEKYFIQTANIDASETRDWDDGKGFEPIGNDSIKFSGSYNGQHYVIDSLYINRLDDDNIGFFGYTSGADIKNVGIANSTVTGAKYVGGLIGNNKSESTISYCFCNGVITGDGTVGGLVGNNIGNSTISNCYATCYVYGANNSTGGLVGAGTNNSTISNCYSTGLVSGDNCVGGLVGSSYYSALISNCYSVCIVHGNDCVGGFVGDEYIESTISECFFNNELSGQNNAFGEDYSGQSVDTLSVSSFKQKENFLDWDFSENWEMTEGTSFPRLKGVFDLPVILANTKRLYSIDVENYDTIRVIQMDEEIESVRLVQKPLNLTFTDDSLITWIPTETMDSIIEVEAKDVSGNTNLYLYDILSLSGEGTKNNPCLISTLEDLQLLSGKPILWDKYFIQTSDIDASDTRYWYSEKGFSPIGNYSAKFKGVYNGNGYYLSNLYINRPDDRYVGLFGCLSGAEIDSLGLVNCSVAGFRYVGGIAGSSMNSTLVSNCYNIGIVAGSYDVGGLVGDNGSTVSRSYSTGFVSAETYNAGGLVGENESNSAVLNSYSTGSVYGNIRAGGLIGFNYSASIVSKCYSSGSVSSDENVGGLIGGNSTSAVNCYYNMESSRIISGDDSQYVAALTTQQMKQSSSFEGWGIDTSSVWGILENKTYPALKTVNNAPFSFPDTIISDSHSIAILLQNDYDYETVQENLAVKIDSSDFMEAGMDFVDYLASIEAGKSIRIVYRAGEISSVLTDTLWGNQTVSYLVYDGTTVLENLTNSPNSSMIVYPNPVKTAFYISGINGTAELFMYDLYGKLVNYQIAIENESIVDVTNLPAGEYFIKLKEEDQTTILKITRVR